MLIRVSGKESKITAQQTCPLYALIFNAQIELAYSPSLLLKRVELSHDIGQKFHTDIRLLCFVLLRSVCLLVLVSYSRIRCVVVYSLALPVRKQRVKERARTRIDKKIE
jgi:hypothetical protein